MRRFGEILTELRHERGMTQDCLGKVIFVSSGTISNYENNVHYPDVEKLVILADIFDVSVDYLLGRSSSKHSSGVYEQCFWGEKTIGDMVQAVQDMPDERKRALNIILEDMSLASAVERTGGKKK